MKVIQKTILAACASSVFISQVALSSNAGTEQHWGQWPSVGQAQLSVFIFDVYQSNLKTPTGDYLQQDDVTPHPLALSIDYQRDISQRQLIDATEEQWQKLGYGDAERKHWIRQLDQIFPDIEEGQNLTYVTDGQYGQFYYTTASQTAPSMIGTVNDEALNDAFLSIWLSPKTQYPELRSQLIGNE
ncbi:hypothetical protein VISI1226_18201 [Vibrio sinaloensis DSM 21326]|uniref:Chalcone isomerase domain-containing protein n=1 Tax=Vibrio sinaloensis DSM 21326 TaxID=945550 RepID=E8M7C1_PHOS4|nr:chalcone isomerase family protein [Vibrio sinaloensis]EGA70080.1 hypothetical protein VISI1226_18201 [Vibrio sinaloensis DSM 21326]